jgi:hypothetical protein
MTPDVEVYNAGTIILLTGRTGHGEEWLAQHLPDDCPRMGSAYAVEHRYAGDIIEGALGYGLVVE